jgi:hypothetical protein
MNRFGRAGSTFVTVVAAAIVLAIATTSGAVAGSLITSKKIKNNTIKSIDVRDGTLKGVDVADGALGKADLAPSARGFTSIVTKRQTVAAAAGATTTMNVTCPAGAVAIGGGGYTIPTGIVLIGTTAGELDRSHPANLDGSFVFAAGDNIAPNSWRTVVHNTLGDPSTNVHYAICATK